MRDQCQELAQAVLHPFFTRGNAALHATARALWFDGTALDSWRFSGYESAMKMNVILVFGMAAVGFLTGCQSLPPGAEPGPHRTMAYYVSVEASPPGARIEVNGEYVGQAPLTFKVFGDPDGTFHDFGSYVFSIRALPLTTNQFPQVRVYRTGRSFTPEDMIPKQLYFDMNVATPVIPVPMYGPGYANPDAGPPVYIGPPIYVGPPWYYGPPRYGPGYWHYYGPHRRW